MIKYLGRSVQKLQAINTDPDMLVNIIRDENKRLKIS